MPSVLSVNRNQRPYRVTGMNRLELREHLAVR